MLEERGGGKKQVGMRLSEKNLVWHSTEGKIKLTCASQY